MIYYTEKEKKPIGFIIISLFLIVIIYILVNLINRVDLSLQSFNKQEVEEVTSFSSNEVNVQNLIENSMYSVVGISKFKENLNSAFLEDSAQNLGMASGVIVSQNGYILTNKHIAGGLYNSCYITLRNGEKLTGKVIWEDDNLDIAILETNAITLPCMVFSDDKSCSLGERIYLLSNFTGSNLQECAEEGIISKLNNSFIKNEKYIENVVNIDIEVDSRNTGGAVINENGELIGIVSSENNSVIPISRVQNVIARLVEGEKVEKIDLGIYGLDTDRLKYIDESFALDSGIYVEKVSENSILKDFIKEKDIITKIDGIAFSKMGDLKEYIWQKNKGDKIVIYIIEEGIEKQIEIEL